MKTNIKTLTYSGFFIALGVLFPQIFHFFGGTGPVFLPMHIPVLLAGFFLGAKPAALVGFITVLLSAAFTGMPAVPVLYFMIVEVTVYGFVAGLAYKHFNLNIYLSLIIAMITGRIALAATLYLLQPLLGLQLSPYVYMTTAVMKGIPGMIIQILFIPVTVMSIERAMVKRYDYKAS